MSFLMTVMAVMVVVMLVIVVVVLEESVISHVEIICGGDRGDHGGNCESDENPAMIMIYSSGMLGGKMAACTNA